MTIQTALNNSTPLAVTVTVVQELEDKDGTIVSKHSTKITLPGSGNKTVTQEMKTTRPHLWSVENPYLYTLKTTVYQGDEVTDQSALKAGIRTLRFDPNKGFFLNGKNLKVKGVCLHHDAGMLGSAVPREVWAQRLETLRLLGCNAIRTSHNPQAPSFTTCAMKRDSWSLTKPSTNGNSQRRSGLKAGMWEPRIPGSRGIF